MDLKQSFSRLTKADFADALGVVLTDDGAAVAHVRKRFNTVSVQAFASRALSDVPVEGRWAVIVDFLREFATEQGLEEARVSVALGRRDSLLGHMQIPATALENIDGVVRYELDRILPIAPDALYTAQCWRPLGTVGERVAVSVIAGLRERVDDVHREFAAAGFAPSAVTSIPVALNDYYNFCRGDQEETAGIFYRDGDRECMTVSSGGRLISSLHCHGGEERRVDRVRRELETTAPELAAEPLLLIVDGETTDESDGDLAGMLPLTAWAGSSRPTWREAAAIGAALAQLGEARAKINLLPAGMARAEEGVGLREMALAALVFVLAATLAGSIAYKNLSVSSALAAEVSRLLPRVSDVTEQEEENRQLEAKVQLLEKHRKTSVLAYLRAMTQAVPDTAYLTTFRFKGDRIEVDGIAENASALISLLERSAYFKNVEFTAPTTKYLQSQERFSLRMGLE